MTATSASRLPALMALGAVTTFIATPSATLSGGRGAVRFRPVEVGIEHAQFASADGQVTGHAFRIELARVHLALVPAGKQGERGPVSDLVRGLGRVLAANASFFDVDGSAMGLVVSEGRLLSRTARREWDTLIVQSGAARIVRGAADLRERPELAVQGIPTLVRAGRVVAGLRRQSASRTALCAEGPHLILVVTGPVETGRFAEFLAAPPANGLGLGCTAALNLDGGPSTQLVARLRDLTLSLPGVNQVPNAFTVRPR